MKPSRETTVGRAVPESQRDSIIQPKVASLRATLGQRRERCTTLKGLYHEARQPKRHDATPFGLSILSGCTPKVAAAGGNLGLNDGTPLAFGSMPLVRLGGGLMNLESNEAVLSGLVEN